MRDTELYERLLGLKEPWKVKAVKMDVEGRRVEVEVECDGGLKEIGPLFANLRAIPFLRDRYARTRSIPVHDRG